MTKHDSLLPVQDSELEGIQGGVTSVVSRGTDTQTLQAMQAITDSLSDLQRQQNTASSSLTQLLPIMMIARARQ